MSVVDTANNNVLRVLVISYDHVSISCLLNKLTQCKYHVTVETKAMETMKLLQNGNQNVDLIMIDDDNMIGMDGHELYENVASFNIPFILLSSNVSKEFVMKGIGYGACDFMSKHVGLYDLQNIWRHLVRRRNEFKTKKLDSTTPIESFQAPNKLQNVTHSRKVYGKRKDHSTNEEKIKHAVLLKKKKRRVVWSQDLHHKFIAVVDKIGLENAVPKKILELMSDEKLTRENVASHLQKYRLSLKKSSQPAKRTTPFCASSNPTDGQGVVNNIQSISNNMSAVSQFVPFGDQASTFMNINGDIYSGFQMNGQNMFSVLSTPLVEFDCVNQPYVESAQFVSEFPSNMADYNFIHGGCSPIQSPILSMSWLSNDSIENMLICASPGHVDDGRNANENELLYEWSEFTDYKTIVDSELLSDGSTLFVEDYNLLREMMNIDDDNAQIVNGGMMSNLKIQQQMDDYVPMQPR